jgi:Ca2+-transporting ATPase
MFDQGTIPFSGLSDEAVAESQKRFGTNALRLQKGRTWLILLKGLLTEPMILLLLIAAAIYFWLGDSGDALFMLGAIFFVAGISIYQDYRSRKAVKALKELAEPQAKVVRNGVLQSIPNGRLVMGDVFVVEEGTTLPADGIVLQANDFSVNESILTGESLPVFKNEKEDSVFMGTQVASGLAICEVVALGNQSKLGKIGISMEEVEEKASPLQVQINDFVKKMAILGLVVFALVWLLNYLRSGSLIESLLQALTLAMSILPEEIPVAFSTFMALGAWRLMKAGIIVKQTKTVEALGAANVICLDKTGTITENKMSLSAIYNFKKKQLKRPKELDSNDLDVIETAMWASEPVPFDGMEVALHNSYESFSDQKRKA